MYVPWRMGHKLLLQEPPLHLVQFTLILLASPQSNPLQALFL
jgi:hypothetical protein